MSIDLDRGCVIRRHPSGIAVAMYYDSPGVFYNEQGETVPKDFAAATGFDVETLDRERQKKQRLDTFKRQLELEYASENDRIAQALSAGGKLRAKHIGGGQYAIFDGDTQLTKYAMTKTDAALMLSQLSGDDGNRESSEEPPEESGTLG